MSDSETYIPVTIVVDKAKIQAARDKLVETLAGLGLSESLLDEDVVNDAQIVESALYQVARAGYIGATLSTPNEIRESLGLGPRPSLDPAMLRWIDLGSDSDG